MAEAAPRLFIWAQHLLGIGHAMRAAAIASACAERGWWVDLVLGGRPIPDLKAGRARLHQLPELRAADAAFSHLVGADGAPADRSLLDARRDRLLSLFSENRPDVLMTEHYPFGRRQLRSELEPLLDTAEALENKPMVVASLRDILVARRPERTAETVEIVKRRYDRVLVHADPALVDLGASFDGADLIRQQIAYTGYVSGPARNDEPGGGSAHEDGPVVVSTGGGAVGIALAETALAAAKRRPDWRWHLLIGHGLAEPAFSRLREAAPPNALVERARPDFRRILSGSAASVSQAGYNTVVDLLVTGTPGVLVPFAADGETEQTLRATRMARQGHAVMLPERELTPDGLTRALDLALTLTEPRSHPRLGGEIETERLLRQWLAAG